jgi:solute carrier family 7 (L-type amino acid transporter), member 9/15
MSLTLVDPEPIDALETSPLLDPEREQADGNGANDEPVRGTFTRNLGTREAFAIIIAIVIGSGVFTSPGSIDTNVASPGLALVVWLVGGGLAWTGAATLAELGTAIPGEGVLSSSTRKGFTLMPSAGGVQPYLQYIYGDIFGFLAAWTWVVAVMPATLAILSIVFVESIFSAAGVTDQAGVISHKLLSILVLVVINLANSISTKASTRLNNFFVVTKFVSIAAIVVAGVVVVAVQLSDRDRQIGGGDWISRPWFESRPTVAPDGTTIDWRDLTSWQMLGYYSTALYGALWAYSGWDKVRHNRIQYHNTAAYESQSIYITAEMSSPARQLPLAINTALPSVILCFLAANAAYYILLPWEVVSTTDSIAVVSI